MIFRNSIAVLPFSVSGTNRDADREQGHRVLADGLTLELIHALSRHPELLVTARGSSARFLPGLTEVAILRKKLNVAWLAEGSVEPAKAGPVVTLQLIRTQDGTIAGSFRNRANTGDFPALMESMAADLTGRITADPRPVDPETSPEAVPREALEECMRGEYLLNRLDSVHWQDMVAHFENAHSLHPGYARPRVALCHSYAWLSSIGVLPPVEARTESDRIIRELFEENHHISDVYRLQAEKQFWLDWNLRQALDTTGQALELNRSNAGALVMRGLILGALGRIDEALDALFRAEGLDPFGENAKYCIGLLYRYLGDYEKSFLYLRESLEITPHWLAPRFTMVEVFCLHGKPGEARLFLEQNRELPGFGDMIPVFQALADAFDGKTEAALGRIRDLTEAKASGAVPPPLYYLLAMIHAQAQQPGEALGWIREGIRLRSAPFLFLHIDAGWDLMRSDADFQQVLTAGGLPAPESAPDASRKYEKAPLSRDDAEHIRTRLEQCMTRHQAFLDPTLSLHALAELCDVPVNRLSQYLNGNLESSFYDYLNRHRLGFFMEGCRKGEIRKMSILGLAYESGFNSKTTFNTFFKREMRQTPTEFLKTVL
ncbi:MAG: helix-turn-helix domain-containing protein [Bacteroidales bacterium]